MERNQKEAEEKYVKKDCGSKKLSSGVGHAQSCLQFSVPGGQHGAVDEEIGYKGAVQHPTLPNKFMATDL